MAAYNPIQMPGFEGFGIADALHQARQDQRQKEAQAWDQMMGQARDQRANNEMEMQRQQMEFHQQQARKQQEQQDQERNVKVQEHITELHSKGLGKEAAQFAAAYGITGAQQPTGQAPMAPVEPQVPEFVGPLETPEDARVRAMAPPSSSGTEPPPFDAGAMDEMFARGDSAAQQVQQQQAERDQFGQQQAAYPQQQAEFQQQKAQYDQRAANPVVDYQGPNGLSFQVDPMERLVAAREENKRRAETVLAGLNSNDATAGFAGRIGAEVGAGRDLEQSMDDERMREIYGAGAQNRLDVANVRSAGKKKGSGGSGGARLEGLAELIKMKEDGAPDSAIATRAAQLHIPAGGKDGWQNSTKEVVRSGFIKFREGERMAGLQATDAQGNVIGEWKSPADAQKMNDQTAKFAQLHNRLSELMADIESTGDRALTPEETQRRDSLFNLAAAAGRVYNGLGGTDASQKLEQEILAARGTLGHGWLIGANRDVVKHALDEATAQHDARLKIRLRAGSGSEAGPAPKGKPRANDARLQLAREARDDPDAPPAVKAKAKQILQQAGE